MIGGRDPHVGSTLEILAAFDWSLLCDFLCVLPSRETFELMRARRFSESSRNDPARGTRSGFVARKKQPRYVVDSTMVGGRDPRVGSTLEILATFDSRPTHNL
jgi:hypothetical protein